MNYFKHQNISLEEFEKQLVITRVIYKSGKILYKGKFKTMEELLELHIDDKHDIEYLDEFASTELKKKLIKKINVIR
jgi:hypothetical protein